MTFNKQNFEFVLDSIISSLHLSGNNISDYNDCFLVVDLPIQSMIDKRPNDLEEIRFIVATLDKIGYIILKEGNPSIIKSITSDGLKYICYKKYGETL